MSKDAIIIKTSWLYFIYENNFVDTILRLGKERDELNIVNDQIGSPTFATNIAETILDLIQNQETQIYHFSNDGQCSWYDFAYEIIKLAKIECYINPITTKQLTNLAIRPKNTSMSKRKITKEFGMHISHWKTSLIRCMNNL